MSFYHNLTHPSVLRYSNVSHSPTIEHPEMLCTVLNSCLIAKKVHKQQFRILAERTRQFYRECQDERLGTLGPRETHEIVVPFGACRGMETAPHSGEADPPSRWMDASLDSTVSLSIASH